MTNSTNVRNTILISDTNVLSDDQVTLAINDAVADCPVSDERAQRFLACLYLAQRVAWDKVKSTGGGLSFKKPEPEFFQAMYTKSLRKLGRGKPKKINWQVKDNTEY